MAILCVLSYLINKKASGIFFQESFSFRLSMGKIYNSDSAKFKEYVSNSKNDIACISVNAKNRMGGYTGYSIVELKKFGNAWKVITMNGRQKNCTENYFREVDSYNARIDKITDKYERFKKENQDLLEIDSYARLSVDELEMKLTAFDKIMSDGKKSGLSRDEVIKKMNQKHLGMVAVEETDSYH